MPHKKTEKTLYRKYRPVSWEYVRGQDHIVSALKGAIESDNIPHAYLFFGTRGTGKTSIARIFAESLGVKSSDIYEIDAASNRGIDDVRELRDAVNVLPFESQYKIYIIDEVHMLTKEAFNALLKTLEEPPSHVIFILATTELGKLPETIVSRCETHTFKKPSHSLLKDFVLDTAKKEGYDLEYSSADLIAILGDGSFRDTLGLLQKAISASAGKKILQKEIEVILGAPTSEIVNDFIISIVERDTGKGIGAISKAANENIDMKLFIKLVLRKIRAVLLLRFAKDTKEELRKDFSDEDFKILEDMAMKKDSNISSETIKVFLEAYQSIGYSHIPQIPIELALLELVGDNAKK